jgi:hypothetical protein
MPWAHGCARTAMYRDVLYAMGAWMRKNGNVQGCTVCRGRMDAQERQCTGMYCMPWAHGCARAAMYRDVRAENCSSTLSGKLVSDVFSVSVPDSTLPIPSLESTRICPIFVLSRSTSYFHVVVHFLHFRHPWRSYGVAVWTSGLP